MNQTRSFSGTSSSSSLHSPMAIPLGHGQFTAHRNSGSDPQLHCQSVTILTTDAQHQNKREAAGQKSANMPVPRSQRAKICSLAYTSDTWNKQGGCWRRENRRKKKREKEKGKKKKRNPARPEANQPTNQPTDQKDPSQKQQQRPQFFDLIQRFPSQVRLCVARCWRVVSRC